MKLIIIICSVIFLYNIYSQDRITVLDPEDVDKDNSLQKGLQWEIRWNHNNKIGDNYDIYILIDVDDDPPIVEKVATTQNQNYTINTDKTSIYKVSNKCQIKIVAHDSSGKEIGVGFSDDFMIIKRKTEKKETTVNLSGTLSGLVSQGTPDKNGSVSFSVSEKSVSKGWNIQLSIDNSFTNVSEKGEEEYSAFINLPTKGKFNLKLSGYTNVGLFYLDGNLNIGGGVWKKQDLQKNINIDNGIIAYSTYANINWATSEFHKISKEIKTDNVTGASIGIGLYLKGFNYGDEIKDDIINLLGSDDKVFGGANIIGKFRVNNVVFFSDFSLCFNKDEVKGLKTSFNLGVEIDGRLVTISGN